MSTSSRIISNTIYLYIKMGITVFISLYTTRIILESLGSSDFGIFTVVGGAIAMFLFLNSTLANATQRFMSYYEGTGVLEEKKKVFNISLILHLIIGFLTSIALILAFFPLFNSALTIEPNRISAAKIVYFCLVFSTFITVINVPYESVLNSHENMLYFSIVGIFESLLKLSVAFACKYTLHDKLIVYGILMAMIPVITLTAMKIYCHLRYDECVIKPFYYWDKLLFKRFLSFSGWNFMTAISSLFTAQGIGIVLNHFFGTVHNASQGIANQLNGYMSAFSISLMKALNPVIVKKTGANDIDARNKVTLAGCRYSTYLIMLLSIPCIIEMPYVLELWLKEVPEWTVLFCRMQLILTIIVESAAGVSTAIYANGDIKWYAVYKSIMNILPVILVYLCFYIGGSPIWLYLPMLLFWGIGGNIVIIHYAKQLCEMSILRYLKGVAFPIVCASLLMLLVGESLSLIMEKGVVRLCLCSIVTTATLILSVWLFGSEKDERMVFRLFIKNNILHHSAQN